MPPANATYTTDSFIVSRIANAALASGQVYQDFDGLAGIVQGLKAVTSGDRFMLAKAGRFELPKAATYSLLAGGRAYWDRTNSRVTWNKAQANSYYIGVVAIDAAQADTIVAVDLNLKQSLRASLQDDAFATVLVGAATATKDGFGSGAAMAVISTSEAEKSDGLSTTAVAIADGPILEARFALIANGSDATVDFNFGLANNTHATDADSITEHVFFHIDGGSLVINTQSKDGTTTVPAATSTVSAVVGTYNEFWIDARDPSNVKLFIDGVRVNSGSTFKLNLGTGPIKALAHVEKTTGAATGSARFELLSLRSTDLLT